MDAELLGQIAGVLAIIPVIPYVRGILKGDTKPNKASWVIWLVVGILLLASYYASGARSTVWVPISYVLFPVIVLPLAFKYGVGGLETFDKICLLGAIAGLILWVITRNPQTALYVVAGIDVIGYLPTIKKTFVDPSSEDKTTWILASGAAFLNILAVNNWQSFHIYFYPIYIFIFEFTVTLLCLKLIRKRKRSIS